MAKIKALKVQTTESYKKYRIYHRIFKQILSEKKKLYSQKNARKGRQSPKQAKQRILLESDKMKIRKAKRQTTTIHLVICKKKNRSSAVSLKKKIERLSSKTESNCEYKMKRIERPEEISIPEQT